MCFVNFEAMARRAARIKNAPKWIEPDTRAEMIRRLSCLAEWCLEGSDGVVVNGRDPVRGWALLDVVQMLRDGTLDDPETFAFQEKKR